MCGRFSNRYTWRELHALYELSVGFPPSNFQPHYNIAPTQDAWVVRRTPEGRELVSLRWGLVPSWAKDIKIGASMINARAETLGQKFRAAFETRPCLVVADGFYEWKKEGKKGNRSFLTLKQNAPFAFGGLWERWQPPEGRSARDLHHRHHAAERTLRGRCTTACHWSFRPRCGTTGWVRSRHAPRC